MEPDSLSPAAEARFKAYAGRLSDAEWQKLIEATTKRLLSQLTLLEVVNDAALTRLAEIQQTIAGSLVDHTNVVLTCLAEREDAA